MIVLESKLILLVFILLNGAKLIVNGQIGRPGLDQLKMLASLKTNSSETNNPPTNSSQSNSLPSMSSEPSSPPSNSSQSNSPPSNSSQSNSPPSNSSQSNSPPSNSSQSNSPPSNSSQSNSPPSNSSQSNSPPSKSSQSAEKDVSTPHSSAIADIQVLLKVKVSGFIYPTASRIIIDLESSGKDCKAKNAQCVIALHLDVRFFEDQILLNTFRSGRWDFKEERTSKVQHLKNGDHEFNIVVLEKIFLIMIDNSNTITYEHRVPISNIKKVYVRGDIDLKTVEAKKWECS